MLALLAACGSSSGDWTSKPIVSVSSEADGIKFTIDAPEGMRVRGAELDFHIDGYVKTPNIRISKGGTYAKTLDDFKKSNKDVTDWIRAETLPDGYIATYENTAYKGKEDYLVHVEKTANGKTLACDARVTPWDKGATTKDKLPQLEKICLSIKPG
jgi:hypothetical protein